MKQQHHWFGFQSYLAKEGMIPEQMGLMVAELLRQPHPPREMEIKDNAPLWLPCLVAQAWHMLRYDWQGIIAADEQFQRLDRRDLPIEVEAEQKFTTIVARARLDQIDIETQFQLHLAPFLSRHNHTMLALAFAAERAAELMGKGLYREALRILEDAAEEDSFSEGESNFWKLRYEIVAGICQEAIGEYAISAAHLQRQESILRQCPHPVLWLAYARRQLSHYIESESLALADDFRQSMEKSIAAVENPVLQSMYLDECFRLHVELGRPQMAENCFASQEEAVRLGKIPQSLILLSHERCELALARYDPERAAQTIINELWWIQRSGSPSAQALAMYALARAHAGAGNFDAAFHNGELGLAICEKYHFGRTMVRLTLFLVSMACRLGNFKLVGVYLRQAESRLDKIQLPLHRDLLLVLRFHFSPKQILWRQEVGRFRDEREFSLLEGWAKNYFFLPQVSTFLGYLTRFAQGEVGFHSETQTLIFWSHHQGLEVMELGHSSNSSKLIIALLKHTRHGMSLFEIHAEIWRSSKYQSHRHSARVHSLIKATRRQLSSVGLTLIQTEGKYLLLAPKGIFRMGNEQDGRSLAKTRRRRALPKYRDTIIQLLQKKPMSGIALASHLEITAQSLHPVLKEMEKAAMLRLEKKGRYSLYHLI